MTVEGAEKWPTIADNAGPETISYMQRHGFPKMIAAIKGARSLRGRHRVPPHVRHRCASALRAHHLRLTAYSYETDDATGAVLPRLKDKDNHVIDALPLRLRGSAPAGRSKRSNRGLHQIRSHGGSNIERNYLC